MDTEHGLARSSDPETSHAAARGVNATKLERLFLKALRGVKEGGTADEIAEYLDRPLNTISPRTRPLVNKGLIKDSGERRATRSGRKAIVWTANMNPIKNGELVSWKPPAEKRVEIKKCDCTVPRCPGPHDSIECGEPAEILSIAHHVQGLPETYLCAACAKFQST